MATEDIAAPASPPPRRPRTGQNPGGAARRALSEGPRTQPYPTTLALPIGALVRGDMDGAASGSNSVQGDLNQIVPRPRMRQVLENSGGHDSGDIVVATPRSSRPPVANSGPATSPFVQQEYINIEMESAEQHARDVQRLQELRALGRAGIEQERLRTAHAEALADQRQRAIVGEAQTAISNERTRVLEAQNEVAELRNLGRAAITSIAQGAAAAEYITEQQASHMMSAMRQQLEVEAQQVAAAHRHS